MRRRRHALHASSVSAARRGSCGARLAADTRGEVLGGSREVIPEAVFSRPLQRWGEKDQGQGVAPLDCVGMDFSCVADVFSIEFIAWVDGRSLEERISELVQCGQSSSGHLNVYVVSEFQNISYDSVSNCMMYSMPRPTSRRGASAKRTSNTVRAEKQCRSGARRAAYAHACIYDAWMFAYTGNQAHAHIHAHVDTHAWLCTSG